ncbi:MAG: isomerizing glutamine--fructose-6-phosphate transaminase [Alphaproteobacteria bacterium]|nr:isomerizing glutamine--fructose-6-phosphate transaminase [Alphaproteobacteria bacterium]
MVAKYWFEKMAGLPVELDVASEFRYRQGPMIQGGAVLAVSQSGETADTLAALQYAKQHQQKILAVLNVPHSSMGRLADVVVPTLAGPEIGVASTKAYVTQLVVLFCMAVGAGLARGAITHDDAKKFLLELRHLPARMNDVLQGHEKYIPVGHDFAARQHLLYLGRNLLYPLALEGALKLKEISYVHAEGFAAGEMKHGPIALIDEQVPVVMLAHKDILLEKTISNLQEVMARGAPVCLIADEATAQSPTLRVSWKMPVPHTIPELAPMLFALPVQLLAYYTAVAKGTDVDQPRNLAKSVTVE